MAGRGGFSNKFGFIAAAAGSAVGLGNIWKFPFEVGNGGGGAFVIMYLFFCFVLCFPVMISEIAIGRKTARNPVGAFNALGYKNWNFIGKLGLVSGILILSFYNVVAGWAFGYFIELSMGNFNIGANFEPYVADWVKVGGFAIIFMLATAYIVSKGISGGVEKAAKILMPTLVVIILLMVGYAVTLPNAIEGVKFYIIPNFDKINFGVVYSAMGQAFFSLSLGMGALITYGSYVSKNDNIVSSAVLITLADVGIAFIAGLMMFPFVFYQNLDTDGGAGLIFVTLPGVFETLGPLVGRLVGAGFFLLLSFAALTSTVSLLEVPVAYAVDELEIPRKRSVILVALLIFVIGFPSLLSNGAVDWLTNFITYGGGGGATDFMTFIQHIASDSFLPLGGFLITVFVAYIWKKEELDKEVAIGAPSYMGSFTQKFIGFAVTYLCPAVLGIIFLFTVLDRFFGIKVI